MADKRAGRPPTTTRSGAGPRSATAGFPKFDDENLAFLYREQVKSGDESRFFKLVRR